VNRSSTCPALLANVWRGDTVESRHYGALAIVGGSGDLQFALGDIETPTFFRSSAKPFQAVPLLTSTAAEHFGLCPEEIAIACGSHLGQPRHTAAVRGILQKLGLSPEALQCGCHSPYDPRLAADQRSKGTPPDVLQNNCSGKHAGMLAVALQLNAPTATYFEAAHPVQQQVLKTIALFSGEPAARIITAADGCGVPTYAMSVRAMAQMFARLVNPPDEFPPAVRSAAGTIVTAMTTHPEMVAGDGELDTELMRLARGSVVAKIGAEGIFACGVRPSSRWPEGFGLAFKIDDGSARPRSAIALEVLRQLEVISETDLIALEPLAHPTIKNHRGEIVGHIEATPGWFFALRSPRPRPAGGIPVPPTPSQTSRCALTGADSAARHPYHAS
jgi:L-asparaginase II